MMMNKAALIGGVVAGVLSGLPVIGGCCFLWAIGGGILAIYLYMKNTPAPMEMADAAKLGAIAGAIGAAISLALGLPFMMMGVGTAALQNNPDLERAGIGAGALAGLGFVGLLIRAASCSASAHSAASSARPSSSESSGRGPSSASSPDLAASGRRLRGGTASRRRQLRAELARFTVA